MSQAKDRLIRAYETMLQVLPTEVTEKKRAVGEFDYIPFNNDMFLEQLDATKSMIYGGRERPQARLHFVDVGCGVGSKVILAQDYFSRCSGIEITPTYAEVATTLLAACMRSRYTGAVQGGIIEGDARTIDYRLFDVIYFYCPMADSDKQFVLEEQIVKTAKVGAYIIANNKRHPSLWTDNPRLRRAWREQIFEKVKK